MACTAVRFRSFSKGAYALAQRHPASRDSGRSPTKLPSPDLAAALSVPSVAEWLNLDWGLVSDSAAAGELCPCRVIRLRGNCDFRSFAGTLRSELDRVGPAEAELSRDFFRRAIACYAIAQGKISC